MNMRRHFAGLLAAALLGTAASAAAEPPAANGVQAVPLDMNRVYMGLAYGLKADAKTHAIVQTFFDLKIPIIPLPKNIVDSRYDPSLDAVFWNASAAVQVADDSGAGTGKFVSPSLLLLDAMAHAVAHAQSPAGYADLAASPDPAFGSLEQRRVIAGLSQSDADAKLHDRTPAAVAAADQILAAANGNGFENAVAAALGEPVRTNVTLVLKDGKPVEGVTYVTVDNPTWHHN